MKFTERVVRSLLIACALVFMIGVAIPSAHATNLVQNGGFQTTSLSGDGGYFCSNGASGTCISNVSNWTSVCRNGACGGGGTPTSLIITSDGRAFNSGIGLQGNVVASPNGGNYVAADADSVYNSTISQSISGLTVGSSYTLTFYQAASQQKGASTDTTDQFQVSLGASTQLAAIMTNASGTFTPWTLQTLVFKADATTDTLSFLATSPSGAPPIALLDGVSLAPTATPEVSTSYLAFSAFVLIALYARFRQRRSQA